MIEHLHFFREHAPGFSGAYLMLSAPQLGVRHARRLHGAGQVRREHWDGQVRPDEIGVSPSLSPKFANVSVPYGAIVPATLDGLLAPGRHLACDASSHSFLREIPQCWLTGHAAGAAAALAVARNVAPPRSSGRRTARHIAQARGLPARHSGGGSQGRLGPPHQTAWPKPARNAATISSARARLGSCAKGPHVVCGGVSAKLSSASSSA